MIQIVVDQEVIDKLGEIAKPFIETTPNMVIRRLLGLSAQPQVVKELKATALRSEVIASDNIVKDTTLPSEDVTSSEDHYIKIEQLRRVSSQTHPAFLTFLMDKYQNTKGNYKISDIMEFMDKANLHFINNLYRNPWMKTFYRGQKNGLISCQRTIEHFRQTRKFGCWGGRDDKSGCNNYTCQYHPKNVTNIRNKCDLRNGVIWKRSTSHSPYSYGANYLQVVKKELLKNKSIPIRELLKVLYPKSSYDNKLAENFFQEFHLNDQELKSFF
jgi:hypothetical protein